MSTINSKNPRAKKLNKIMSNIAMFMFQETYVGEEEAQRLMEASIQKLEEAAELLIKSDENQKE